MNKTYGANQESIDELVATKRLAYGDFLHLFRRGVITLDEMLKRCDKVEAEFQIALQAEN